MPDDGFKFFDEIDSTNSYCIREAAELASGTVVVADRQTAGKGRMGRTWQSPPGVNLYASIILKPPFMNMGITLFPQVAALAVYNTVREYGVDQAWIKWPNDIHVNVAKLAGVLSENRVTNNVTEAVVVGIGVNVNMAAADMADIGRPATSILVETGRRIDRDDFLVSVFKVFNRLYASVQNHGFSQLHSEWKGASRLLDRRVRLLTTDKEVHGVVTDFGRDGSIEMRLHTGETTVYYSGDVSLVLE